MSDKNEIKFKCQQCGTYCRLPLGYVFLKRGEDRKISDFLKMPLKDFRKKYVTNMFPVGKVLTWDDAGSCHFLNGNKCSVYAVRPVQCSSYPYWKRLKKKKDLDHAKTYCKGLK